MKVIYAKRSRIDFERIRKRITKESGSPEVADNFIARMIRACDTLTNLPGRHSIYRTKGRWRMMPFGNYLVLFQVFDTHVKVGHIRHAARMTFRG